MIGQSGQAIEVELVEVGMTVFDQPADVDPDQHINGGIVTAIETHVDANTGEVMRHFVCAEPYRGSVRFHTFTADQVRQVAPMQPANVRYLIRQLGLMVSRSKQVLTDQAHAITAMHALMEVLT